jgi:hypothetical protein
LYFVEDAFAFVEFLGLGCLCGSEWYLALQSIFDEHERDCVFFDGSDDGLFDVVPITEVLVSVVVT